jgi:hypothetical protein
MGAPFQKESGPKSFGTVDKKSFMYIIPIHDSKWERRIYSIQRNGEFQYLDELNSGILPVFDESFLEGQKEDFAQRAIQ